MRAELLALVIIVSLLVPTVASFFVPAVSLGTPTDLDVSPANGCAFAEAVLQAVAVEAARIGVELDHASLARQVVLTVQAQSGDNLRAATIDWKQQHCI